MSHDATDVKSLVTPALLTALGILGNHFSVPLFFGAEFIFGGVAVLLVIYFCGLRWGLLAATLVHSYTYFLWGHPYGSINFISEALFVGIFLQRGHRNLLLLDWLFWLLIGMPLAWFYHDVLMHMDSITACFVMLKQAINGVFNALLASLAISYLNLDKLFSSHRPTRKISLQASLFNLMVLMVLVPTLLLTMLQARQEKADLEADVMTELQSLSANVQIHLLSWQQLHQQALQVLASLAAESSMVPSEAMQHNAEILRQSFPDFIATHVEDVHGRIVAFDPGINERGESTVGADQSDRPWFQEMRAKQQPVVSEVFTGRTALFLPIATMAVPVIRDNRWLGCATGTLNLERVRKMLQLYQSNRVEALLTLSDSENKVIGSTKQELKPMDSWDWRKTGDSGVLRHQMYLWSPKQNGLPSMTRWKQSFYVRETPLGPEVPWKLTTEAPVAPLQRVLYTVYVKNLAVMACLTSLGLFLSFIFSRSLTSPLARLARVTTDFPDKIANAQGIDWPDSSAEEFDSLIGNLKSMVQALQATFDRIQVQSGELRQTLHKLNLRESYLTAIIENQPGLLWLKDTGGRFLSVNHAFVQSCGRQGQEDLIGKTDLDIWPRELAEKYRADDSAVMARQAPIVVEEPISDQGVLKWFQTFKTPVFTKEGQVLGTCGFAHDITERKQAEEALHQSRGMLAKILDSVPQSIFWKDRDSVYLGCNQVFAKAAGIENAEEIVGKTDYDLPWPREETEAYRADDRDVVELGRPKVHIIEPVQQADGSRLWVDTTKVPLIDGDGHVYGVLGIFDDVTERKRSEEALRESEERFHSLFSNMAEGVALHELVLDESGAPVEYRIVDHNPQYEKILHLRRQDVVGRLSTEVYHMPEPPLLREFSHVALSGVPAHIQKRFAPMDRHFDISVAPWGDKGFATIFSDITERKRAEQERESLQAQLNQAQKLESVGRLAGGVAHDFNNMLSVILGHAEMAMMKIDQSHALLADLTEIRKAALRSADLTRQLLAFARRQTISPKILDLNETVEGMLKMLRRLIGEDIDLAWLPARSLWPIKVDPGQVDQILANLCVNARDAISGVGKVTIETGTASFDKDYCAWHPGVALGEFVMLVVSDNGCGMDEETLGQIFEPFFTTKGLGEGTGLGLATVYGIVKQNNGFINVYSELGRGTTFKIYLPRAEKQQSEQSSLPIERDLRGKETVLIVEDEEPILALGKAILQQHGYEVLATPSPNEALGMVKGYPGPIHLLITDVVMPEMNGKDLRDKLTEVKPGFKSIFMSGYTADVIAHHGILDKDINFLQKPFSIQTLLGKVRDVLDE